MEVFRVVFFVSNFYIEKPLQLKHCGPFVSTMSMMSGREEKIAPSFIMTAARGNARKRSLASGERTAFHGMQSGNRAASITVGYKQDRILKWKNVTHQITLQGELF